MRSLFFISALGLGFLSACSSTRPKSSAPQQPEKQIRMVVEPTAESRARQEAQGTKWIVATQGVAASEAAKLILESGGNVIDAAVAASFVISVERPQSTGIGGGGFLLFREAKTKKTYAIDFRERAPLKSRQGMFLDTRGNPVEKLSREGALSVAVPGLVAGLYETHKKFGKLSWASVMEPAIRLAENGFPVYPELAEALEDKQTLLLQYSASKAVFLKPDGKPYAQGEILKQKDLAKTLRLIAKKGKHVFYWGEVAELITRESERLGSLVSAKDLARYSVRWRKPIQGTFRGYEVYSMPPPSSGGTHIVEMLNLLEEKDLRGMGFQSAEAIHWMASAMQQAFADRADYMGDPDFVFVPTEVLTSKKYAERMLERFPSGRARRAEEVRAGRLEDSAMPEESTETTHFSILDSEGNAVASTQTINGWIGSGIVVPGTGVLLNNEMDDFSAKPGAANLYGAIGGKPNAIAPGKTPLSSMSPTIVLEKGKPKLVVGAPGGTRIITCVLQTMLNYLEFRLPLYDSVASVRFHHQWKPDVLAFDSPGPRSEVLSDLKRMGYPIKVEEDAVPCRVMAVAREGNLLRGVSDPRDAGTALGGE